MEESSSSAVTTAWVGLHLVLIVVVLILCFVVQSWLWRFALLFLYLTIVIPYGFFVVMPIMVKIFRKPASTHSKQ
jgi:uncharacterized membrane protein